MPDATQVYAEEYEGYWNMSSSITFAGVTTGMTVTGNAVVAAGITQQDVIIDGISIRYTHAPAGGVEVRPAVGWHFLLPFTTATMIGAYSYSPLGIPMRFGTANAFAARATTANLDACYLSAWGRSLVKDAPAPLPVAVKSVRFWPKRLHEGPI